MKSCRSKIRSALYLLHECASE